MTYLGIGFVGQHAEQIAAYFALGLPPHDGSVGPVAREKCERSILAERVPYRLAERCKLHEARDCRPNHRRQYGILVLQMLVTPLSTDLPSSAKARDGIPPASHHHRAALSLTAKNISFFRSC